MQPSTGRPVVSESAAMDARPSPSMGLPATNTDVGGVIGERNMFEPIFERHNVPTADRESLVEYFNRPDGIPESLRTYFLSRKWSRFIR